MSRLVVSLKYIATFLAIWAATLVAAEGGFRLIGDRPSGNLDGLYTQFGSSYRNGPMVDTGANWSTGEFSVHTDSLGLRCDRARRMGASAGDAVDILFLGDSQGFGNGVAFEATIPGTVAALARAQGVTVRTACVGGHHPPNQLEFARWLRDDQRITVSTYIYLFTPPAIASCDHRVEATVGKDGNIYGREPTALTSGWLWLKTHSVVFSRIRDAVRSQGIDVDPAQDTPFVFRLYSATDEGNRVRTCTEFLRSLKGLAAETGANVRLIYLPEALEVDFEVIEQAAARRGVAIDLGVPFRVLEAAAHKEGLPVMDLRPALRAQHSEGIPLSLAPDSHYTVAVSQFFGKAIWEAVSGIASDRHGEPRTSLR